MKVSAMIVASLDGKLTRGEERDIYQWASPEDGVYFKKYRSEADVIVMGRRTYETIKKTVDLSMKAVRVVMTHSPEKYHNDEPARGLSRMTNILRSVQYNSPHKC